jgi:hypothetical protein
MPKYRAHSGTCDQILLSVRRLLSQSCCLVSLGCPLWREVGSVICHSQSVSILSQSHVTTDGQSVSQYAKVSNPLWDLWPDITFCPKIVVSNLLSCLYRVPSLTRGRVCHLSFSVYNNLSVFTSSIYVTCVLQFSNVYTINIKLQSVSSEYSRLCSSSYY